LTGREASTRISVYGPIDLHRLSGGLIFQTKTFWFFEREFFMANHVSSLKRARQTVKRTAVNRANRSKLRNGLRAMREAIAQNDAGAARTQYSQTVSLLDKSVQKGILHDNTASRYKSRLNARVKALAMKTA
jgi:small subunit ribosomal protein S20